MFVYDLVRSSNYIESRHNTIRWFNMPLHQCDTMLSETQYLIPVHHSRHQNTHESQDFSSPLKSYKKISDLISYLQTIFINYDKKLHLPRRPSFIIGASIVILCYFSIRAIKIHVFGAKKKLFENLFACQATRWHQWSRQKAQFHTICCAVLSKKQIVYHHKFGL